MIQPLFPTEDDSANGPRQDANYLLHHGHGRKVLPVSADLQAENGSEKDVPAVELIRRKVDALFANEPDASAELARTVPESDPHRSPHQQFMHELSASGKSLAQIQTAWHNYYIALPDHEKHAVWQEFYAANSRQPSAYTQYVTTTAAAAPVAAAPRVPKIPQTHAAPEAPAHAVVSTHQEPLHRTEHRSKSRVKKSILKHVRTSEKTRRKAKQHFQSLLFGLASGGAVLVLFFFGFFNEMIIAPFIQPSRQVSAAPIIIDSDSVAPSEIPEVIIPKLNVQLPVVYDEPSMAEDDIQRALERGVVHYPATVLPGQQGNAAIFGHSSNNIFNKGKYKFAFALLRHLEPGDIFYLTYDKKIYSYRVFAKRIVPPTEVSVLGPVEGKAVTAALITCDPPGTSTNRLVVWGEQISPDPTGAAAPITTPSTTETVPTELPSEAPTLWGRFWNTIF